MCIHHTQDEGHNSRQREFEVFVQTPPPNLFALSKVTDEGCYRNVLWILNYRFVVFVDIYIFIQLCYEMNRIKLTSFILY